MFIVRYTEHVKTRENVVSLAWWATTKYFKSEGHNEPAKQLRSYFWNQGKVFGFSLIKKMGIQLINEKLDENWNSSSDRRLAYRTYKLGTFPLL